MDKLQELLKWLSKANNDQIDGLYEVIFNNEIYYLEEVIDSEDFKQFIKDVQSEVDKCVYCYDCGEEISGVIYCDECLERIKQNDKKAN